jgi:hypothetical protein
LGLGFQVTYAREEIQRAQQYALDKLGEQRGREKASREACVPGMSQRSEVKVLCPARWRRRTREAQGRHREVGSEGSVERMRGARNTNLI